MPYVYSTSTAGVDFANYLPRLPGQHNQIERKVSIAGGSNVANKHLITPLGVATKITDDDAAFLEDHPLFQKMKRDGFYKIVRDKIDSEVAVADMETRDESAPYVPEDFKSGAAPAVGQAA